MRRDPGEGDIYHFVQCPCFATMPSFVEQELPMQSTFGTVWEFVEFGSDPFHREKPNLDLWRWSFAGLPDARTKAIAAGWMVRVWLGGDPAEMSEEESEVVSVGALLGTEPAGTANRRSWCDA
jgi:hypothetical protein